MADRLILEIIEAIENGVNVLDDCEEYEGDAVISSWRAKFWEVEGEGGAAREGLKQALQRLKERYY